MNAQKDGRWVARWAGGWTHGWMNSSECPSLAVPAPEAWLFTKSVPEGTPPHLLPTPMEDVEPSPNPNTVAFLTPCSCKIGSFSQLPGVWSGGD